MTKAARKIRILIIEDEPIVLRSLTDLLTGAGYRVRPEKDGIAGLSAYREEPFDLVLLDLVMPGLSGMKVLEEIRADSAELPVIIMTAHGTVETAVEAMKLGSSEFLTKPFRPEELLARIRSFANLIRLKEENLRLKAEAGHRPIVGGSRAIRDVLAHVGVVAGNDATVLITGESGTGKELVARAIHDQSPRASGPFVKVACPALPETLLEAELFGHEKGAFTGAYRQKIGRFEMADGGTIFLDEIGDISQLVQVKLLRVLQEHAFERVGGNETIAPKVRVVCATRFDLKELVEEGKFREDLFYRLNVVTIRIPPLRERVEDVPLLVEHFLTRSAFSMSKQVTGIQPSCLKLLKSFPWPGNVRQLENAVERAVMFCPGKQVTIADLGPELQDYREEMESPCPDEYDIHCHVKVTERECIIRALRHTAGNRSQAADLLGISRKRLWEKMKELHVEFE